MDNHKETALYVASVVIAFLLGWFLHTQHATPVLPYATRIDTVTKVIDHEPIRITDARAVVRYVRDTVRWGDTVRVRDTVYSTRSFVATIDTVIVRDTITAAYRFPQQTFSLALRRAPDSVRVEMKTIVTYEQRAWWVDALGALGAGALGYGIGRMP